VELAVQSQLLLPVGRTYAATWLVVRGRKRSIKKKKKKKKIGQGGTEIICVGRIFFLTTPPPTSSTLLPQVRYGSVRVCVLCACVFTVHIRLSLTRVCLLCVCLCICVCTTCTPSGLRYTRTPVEELRGHVRDAASADPVTGRVQASPSNVCNTTHESWQYYTVRGPREDEFFFPLAKTREK